MKNEKWIETTDGVHPVSIKVINPAYVEELEAFAKEMAEEIVNVASLDEFECPFCSAEGIGACDSSCLATKAEQWLKGV